MTTRILAKADKWPHNHDHMSRVTASIIY